MFEKKWTWDTNAPGPSAFAGNVFLADVQKAFCAQNLRGIPICHSMILHDRARNWKAFLGVMTF
jgi:hypothetical protein